MSNSGTIRITARTLDLAREALDDWRAENPERVPNSVIVTNGAGVVVIEARWVEK